METPTPDEIFSLFARGHQTYLMGILNVTPDSFSDGGAHLGREAALAAARRMRDEGAAIIDIGGESTRPGSSPVSTEEELARVLPVIEALVGEPGMVLSIDTTKAVVAREALARGVRILNDIHGLQGPEGEALAAAAAESGAGVVMMHYPAAPLRDEALLEAIGTFFERSIERARAAGIPRHHLVLDPGIGFGKTLAQNWQILRSLRAWDAFGLPILLGASRKSFLGKRLDLPDPADRLAATLATTAAAIAQGVDFIRVHDVAANRDVARVCDLVHRPLPA
ncbi:MAG: dihydropteroate synthase [Opitutales bacterium]